MSKSEIIDMDEIKKQIDKKKKEQLLYIIKLLKNPHQHTMDCKLQCSYLDGQYKQQKKQKKTE